MGKGQVVMCSVAVLGVSCHVVVMSPSCRSGGIGVLIPWVFSKPPQFSSAV